MLRLHDNQWDRVQEYFPEQHIPESRPGRKPESTRAILEAVLWILNTGAQWHLLSQCYPNYKTIHCRFQQWCGREMLRETLTQLANTLREEGSIDQRESFIDSTFAMAKGGGAAHSPGESREDPGDCLSSWAPPVREHKRGQSSSGHAGPTQFQNLNTGGQARTSHRRSGVRRPYTNVAGSPNGSLHGSNGSGSSCSFRVLRHQPPRFCAVRIDHHAAQAI